MNLFCRQCGHKNEEDAGFCESCGAPLRGPTVAPTPAPPPPKASSKRGLVVIVALILLIVVGLAAALLVPSSPVPALLAKLGIRLPTGGSTGDMLYYVGQAGKWGYVEKRGTTVIPLQFDAPFSVGEHKSFMVKSGPPYPVFQAGKWVLVDKRGERLGRIAFDRIEQLGYGGVQIGEGPIVCGTKLNNWGCADAQGAEVIPFTFDWARPAKDNFIFLMTKGLAGLADRKGAFVIQPTFRYIWAFSDGLALAQFSDQKWGLINREGKEVSKKRFDGAASPAEGLWPVKTGDTWALADPSGEVIQPLTGLGYVDSFHEGLAYAIPKSGNLTGYIDRSGKFVISPQFGGGEGFQDGIARVRIKSRSGLIGRDGRYVVPPVFDEMTDLIDGVALAWKGEELWLIDRAGQVIWPKEKRSHEPPTRDFAKISASKWQVQWTSDEGVKSLVTYEFLQDKVLLSQGAKKLTQLPFEASEQGGLQVKFPDGTHNWELIAYGDDLVILDDEDKGNAEYLTRAGPAGGERKESDAGSKPEAKSELFTLPTELEAINVTKPALQKGNPNNPFCSDRSTEDISFVAFGDAKAESGLDQAGKEEVFALLPVTVHAVGKCSAYGIRPTMFDEDIRFLLRGSKLGAWTVERECKDDFKSCFAMRAMGF